MCGRTACTLAPTDICHACGYKGRDGGWKQPRWRDPPGGQQYYPSTNIAPGTHLPILLSKSHFADEQSETREKIDEEGDVTMETTEECDWVVQPMRWGLIPHWHSGDIKNVGYNTINARSDSMLSKPAFKRPLEKGRRCIVLVEGYFEWQNKDGQKQPYFVYTPRSTATSMEEVKVKQEQPDEGDGGSPKRLMMLAGMFNIYRPKDGTPPVYSCTIITVNSHKQMSWLHDRMPAILDGEDEVQAWLDSGSVSVEKAKDLIRPIDKVQHHPVSKDVGKVANKGDDLLKPIDPKKVKETASSKFMSSWLSKSVKPKKRSSPPPEDRVKEEGEPEVKKIKTEEKEVQENQ